MTDLGNGNKSFIFIEGKDGVHVFRETHLAIEDPIDKVGATASTKSQTKERIWRACDDIAEMLCEKNEAYGDSALNPLNVFSKLDATASLCARIDDKLARIANKGLGDATEDTLDDLIGYLILLKLSRENNEKDVNLEQ